MKKGIYLLLILVLSVITVQLTNFIILSTYDIPENIIESNRFRWMEIEKQSLINAKQFCGSHDVEFSRLLACTYLKENYVVKKRKFSLKEWQEDNSNYTKADKEAYSDVCRAMEAIFKDLEYFPVAKSGISKYWVGYDNSFGADRNYNGKYMHEGTDIMAENNISGYYPVVSVTDGVVENLGWLEKGGYRVGIRSQSGGYFYYAHLSSYGNIKKGDKIKAGTLLGYMGDTGYGKQEGTSGNFDVHLHFGIYIKTKNYEELSVNPYWILKYLEDKFIVADY